MHSKSITFLLLLLSAGTVFCEDLNEINKTEPALLTVCEVLEQRLKYNDELVAIAGVRKSTFEGTWLSDNGCSQSVKTQGFTWQNIIWLEWSPESAPDSSALDLVDKAILSRKIELVRGRNELRVFRGSSSDSGGTADFSDRLVVVYGRFQSHPGLRPSQRKDGKGDWGNGYGHLNASPAQLIYQKESVQYF